MARLDSKVWIPILNTVELETELRDIGAAVRSGMISDRTGDHLKLALMMGADTHDAGPLDNYAA
jgi:hypothetical protein